VPLDRLVRCQPLEPNVQVVYPDLGSLGTELEENCISDDDALRRVGNF
jgi:hypothetical protein